MSDSRNALSEEDYAAIESAVMETARGRWFLQEYARRNRNADTDSVIKAIARLEAVLSDRSADQAPAVHSPASGARTNPIPTRAAKRDAGAAYSGQSQAAPQSSRASLSGDVAARLGLKAAREDLSSGDFSAAAERLLPAASRSPFTAPMRPKPLAPDPYPQKMEPGAHILAQVEALTFEEKDALFS